MLHSVNSFPHKLFSVKETDFYQGKYFLWQYLFSDQGNIAQVLAGKTFEKTKSCINVNVISQQKFTK